MLQHREARGGSVHLWMRDIGASGAPVGRSLEVLNEVERRRADRFRFDVHRSRYVRGRAFLRETVATFCGCDPRKLAVVAGDDGKPNVPGCPVAFNLSHSADVAVLAIAAMHEVGVDVECFDRKVECVTLARRFFAKSEVEAVEALPEAAQRELFFRLWTSKEAAMKATGEGLRIDPRIIEVLLDESSRPMRYEGRFASWFLANEDLSSSGVTVSVAAPEPFSIVWENRESGRIGS